MKDTTKHTTKPQRQAFLPAPMKPNFCMVNAYGMNCFSEDEMTIFPNTMGGELKKGPGSVRKTK